MGPVQDGDGVFCLNFRATAPRNFMSALAAPDFDAFDTGTQPKWSASWEWRNIPMPHMAFIDHDVSQAET